MTYLYHQHNGELENVVQGCSEKWSTDVGLLAIKKVCLRTLTIRLRKTKKKWQWYKYGKAQNDPDWTGNGWSDSKEVT